ncbi:hypothetical protein OPQ81_005514 [Rhizoctonia solani]|nr:hypothetical protein OPQ81_005514 [Rhizoctonia solani]
MLDARRTKRIHWGLHRYNERLHWFYHSQLPQLHNIAGAVDRHVLSGGVCNQPRKDCKMALKIVEDRATPKEVYNWKPYVLALIAAWGVFCLAMTRHSLEAL